MRKKPLIIRRLNRTLVLAAVLVVGVVTLPAPVHAEVGDVELKGPITAISDRVLLVLGQILLIGDDTTLVGIASLDELELEQVVEISGVHNSKLGIILVEQLTLGEGSEVRIAGLVESLTPLIVSGVQVRVQSLPETLAVGQRVDIRGSSDGNVILAADVATQTEGTDDDGSGSDEAQGDDCSGSDEADDDSQDDDGSGSDEAQGDDCSGSDEADDDSQDDDGSGSDDSQDDDGSGSDDSQDDDDSGSDDSQDDDDSGSDDSQDDDGSGSDD